MIFQPVTLRPVYGHEQLLWRLSKAIAAGRFPQACLLVGRPGVGKQRVALWAAQALLCDRSDAGDGTPCGVCQSCRQVDGLAHPDLHWFVPITRPKATDPDQQVEEAQTLLAEAVAERRASPRWGPPAGMSGYPLAAIRLLQRALVLRPFQGGRRVVILGDAERLVVQEASQEAANALLKSLEEPPAGTYLILTAAEPQALLPTIRSRLVPVRVGGVGDEAVKRYLTMEVEPKPPPAELEGRAQAAQGSIGQALWARDSSGNAERAAGRLAAAVKGGASRWAQAALAQPPWAARGDFTAMLDALLLQLRSGLAERASGGSGEDRHATALRRGIAAVRRVEDARAAAQGNLNPQLALAALASDLEALL